jgi:hypothetical protein
MFWGAPQLPRGDVATRAMIGDAPQIVEAWIAACVQGVAKIAHRNQDVGSKRSVNTHQTMTEIFYATNDTQYAAISPARRGNLSRSARQSLPLGAAISPARSGRLLARSLQLLPARRRPRHRQRCAGESAVLALGLPAVMLLIPNCS